jgi:hypothetical protein
LGRVHKKDKACQYVIDKVDEIKEIINIFTKRPLNTTKHLNFLNFKEAFIIYINSEPNEILHEKLDSLKNKMNSQREDFQLPSDHQHLITPNWFLGFVEGEGSFWVRKKELVLYFALSQAHTDLRLMKEISQFLNNLPGAKSDIQPKELLTHLECNYDGVARLYTYKKSTTESRGEWDIKVADARFIWNVLIPFFDSLIWHSKKHKDFQDWKVIFKLKKLGLHYTKEGLELIEKIMSQMNTLRSAKRVLGCFAGKRLSSSDSPRVNRAELDAEIFRLLNDPASNNYELKEGRIWIKSLNRFQKEFRSSLIQVWDNQGNLLETYPSPSGFFLLSKKKMNNCSKSLGINRTTLDYRLQKNITFKYEGKLVYLKRG